MRLPFFRSGKSASAADPLSPVCANCGNPLAVGQDWCLDCGTAVRGRLGGGPGVGSSIGVVGLTLLLVLGAVAAAYAALNSDSNRAVKTPPAAAVAGVTGPRTPDIGPTTPGAVAVGTTGAVGAPGSVPTGTTAPINPPNGLPPATLPRLPAVTQNPPAPGAVAPPVTTTRPPVAPPVTTTRPPVAPPVTTTRPPVTPPVTTTRPPVTPPVTTPTARTPPSAPHPILLDTDAATVYNPYSLPAASFTDPSRAVDGDPGTAWSYQLDPTTLGKTLVGLAINLKTPQAARAIKITTLSPGMTVEFYGASGSTLPVSITDPGWVHLADRRAIKPSTSIVLKTQGKSYRYLLVWITHAPGGVTTGSVGISELSVRS